MSSTNTSPITGQRLEALPLSPLSPYQQTPRKSQFVSEVGTPWKLFQKKPSAAAFRYLTEATNHLLRSHPTSQLSSPTSHSPIKSITPNINLITPTFTTESGIASLHFSNSHSLPKSITQWPSTIIPRTPQSSIGLGISFLQKKPPPNPSRPGFTVFPKLPIELQLFIWAFTIPGPRLITAKKTDRMMKMRSGKAWTLAQCLVEQSIPAIFHACHHSRFVALKHYKLEFGTNLRLPIYFDNTKDTLLMDNLEVMYNFARMSSRSPDYLPTSLSYLAIHYDAFAGADKQILEHALNQAVRRITNLREFLVLMPDDLDPQLHSEPWKGMIQRAIQKLQNYRNQVCLPEGHTKARCLHWKVPDVLFLSGTDLLNRRAEKALL